MLREEGIIAFLLYAMYNVWKESHMEGKAFEQLQIKDDFMFSVIMRNPKYCKPFLERILGVRILRIEYPKSQETIDITADAKSVRLDIYVEDAENTVYNVEMQTVENRNLPKRPAKENTLLSGNDRFKHIRKGRKLQEFKEKLCNLHMYI